MNLNDVNSISEKMKSINDNSSSVSMLIERLGGAQEAFVNHLRELPDGSFTPELILNVKLQGEIATELGNLISSHAKDMIGILTILRDSIEE